MRYALLKDVINLIETFESEAPPSRFARDVEGFKRWIMETSDEVLTFSEPDWEGKEHGRSPESVINTFIVHMNRYAKSYSKSAIHDSNFTTQEDFIYLINLRAFGPMTKMELIKRNIQEKSAGMQIINRLIRQGWVVQEVSLSDKRSKVLHLTKAGAEALDTQMGKIRTATRVVTGDLTHAEKMELIRLLDKLDRFHKPLYLQNLDSASLLDKANEACRQSDEATSYHLGN